ncbi:MAG: ATP phosphoribosyltransferase [Rubricoccaceae bacterium]
MLRIALPNKGALADDALALVREAGYTVRRGDKELFARDPRHEIEFLFLRPRDIAVYVGSGVLGLGITGRDLVAESGARLAELLPLGFGHAAFRYAVPAEQDLEPDDFGGLRVATSYPSLVAADLARRGVEAEVVPLDGAVEIAVRLGVADAVADVVQTGGTLVRAGLKTVGAPILDSEAVLVARDASAPDADAGVRRFLERVRGIVVARAYAMIEYDVPEEALEQACAVTPGIEAPTISPLSRAGWVAVKAMARRAEVNDLIDALTPLGARGIIVTDIRTCRI